MNEKVYNGLNRIGAWGIVVGIIMIVCGIALGILSVISGGYALRLKRNVMI